MYDQFIRQAYEELACLRDCLANAERNRVRPGGLLERIALSEARIKALEWAIFNATRT